MVAVSKSVAGENQTFLNVTRMGGHAYIRHPQERMRRHLVDLQTVALLKPCDRDQAFERPMDHLGSIETESSGPYLASHIEECPPGIRQLVFPFVKIQATIDRYPCIRIRVGFGAEKLRERSAFFNQNASGGNQMFGLSAQLRPTW